MFEIIGNRINTARKIINIAINKKREAYIQHGDNLGNVVQFMERQHKIKFKKILNKIAEKMPGIDTIDTEKTPDGRLLLRFNDKGFDDPFYAQPCNV